VRPSTWWWRWTCFTKFAWAFPLDSKHTAGIVAALERAFLQEGPPLTLRTDGGGDMTNADSTALCARYGVERRVCAPYNSQCNGGVERLHATLKAALSRHTHEWLAKEGSVDWVALLPHVLYAYNTSVHSATGLTPFFLQRGRQARPLGPLLLESREGAPLAGPSLYDSVCAAPSAAEKGAADQGTGSSDAAGPAAAQEGGPAAPARVPTAASSSAVAGQALAPAQSAASLAPAQHAGAAGMAPGRPRRLGQRVPSSLDAAGALLEAAQSPLGQAASATAAPAPIAEAVRDDAEYSISRVLATRRDPVHGATRYWVRWAGFSAADDSWITPAMAGVSAAQLEQWIRRTHRAYPPVALPGPFVTPPGREQLDVPVTEPDRVALRAARDGEPPALLAGGGRATRQMERARLVETLEERLTDAVTAVRKLRAAL
jgi:hypothetical protein